MTTALMQSEALNLIVPYLTRGRGTVQLAARSAGGFGKTSPSLHPGTTAAPLHLLELVRDEWEIRGPVVSHETHGAPATDLCAAFVLWKPAQTFSEASGWRHAIAPAEQTRIAAAIAASPVAPNVLLDGGHEVSALWWLSPPADLADPEPARALLVRMAETLEGDIEAARGFDTVTFPIAGPARNWNQGPADLITAFEVAPGSITFGALQSAFREEKN